MEKGEILQAPLLPNQLTSFNQEKSPTSENQEPLLTRDEAKKKEDHHSLHQHRFPITLSSPWERGRLASGNSELYLLAAPLLKDMEADARLYGHQDDQGPPPKFLDPNWNLLDHLSPMAQAAYEHHQLHRLETLSAAGALIVGSDHSLTLDESGMIAAPGVPPPTREQLWKPPPSMIHGEGVKERLEAMAAQVAPPEFVIPKELKRPSHLLVDDVLKVIERSQTRKHKTWMTLYSRLQSAAPDTPEKTAENLLVALETSIKEEQESWSKLEILSRNPLLIETIEVPQGECVAIICTLAGIDTEVGTLRPLDLLAEIDDVLEEHASDLEYQLERIKLSVGKLGAQANRGATRRLSTMKSIWKKVREALGKGRLEPRFWRILNALRDTLSDQGGWRDDGEKPHPTLASSPDLMPLPGTSAVTGPVPTDVVSLTNTTPLEQTIQTSSPIEEINLGQQLASREGPQTDVPHDDDGPQRKRQRREGSVQQVDTDQTHENDNRTNPMREVIDLTRSPSPPLEIPTPLIQHSSPLPAESQTMAEEPPVKAELRGTPTAEGIQAKKELLVRDPFEDRSDGETQDY